MASRILRRGVKNVGRGGGGGGVGQGKSSGSGSPEVCLSPPLPPDVRNSGVRARRLGRPRGWA